MRWLEMTDKAILDIAAPIMDNLMQASTDIDHARHVRDFTDELKAIVTKENLEAQCKEYQAELGYFSEREVIGVIRKHRDVAIIWRQRMTKTDDEFIAFLRLIAVNGRVLVQNVLIS